MKIVIVTDAWQPQVNGVVTTMSHTRNSLLRLGHRVQLVHPGRFTSLPCPTYPEIRLALPPGRRLERLPIPLAWTYAPLRAHHGHAQRTLVATEHQRRDQIDHGFDQVAGARSHLVHR